MPITTQHFRDAVANMDPATQRVWAGIVAEFAKVAADLDTIKTAVNTEHVGAIGTLETATVGLSK